MIDKTQRTRQQKRRQFLNQAAQAVGFASWSALETAVINGLFSLPLRGITLDLIRSAAHRERFIHGRLQFISLEFVDERRNC